MKIFPAIDLYQGQAVRLIKGDYNQLTVYDPDPLHTARCFAQQGAEYLHMVDLEGAKTGQTPNLSLIRRIAGESGLFTQVGGGIRSMDTVRAYLDNGVDRVILGTAALTDEDFLRQALNAYGPRIAVGVDLRDGYVSIRGWTEQSAVTGMDFCKKMETLGVQTIICTDISRDGLMQGTNLSLYETLQKSFSLDIIASGGVSSLSDVKALAAIQVYGAIIGKAYYTGAIDLREAIEVAK